jgi:hypothetical protein
LAGHWRLLVAAERRFRPAPSDYARGAPLDAATREMHSVMKG